MAQEAICESGVLVVAAPHYNNGISLGKLCSSNQKLSDTRGRLSK